MAFPVKNLLNVGLRRARKHTVEKMANFGRSKLYIVPHVISLWALTAGPRLHRILYASAHRGGPNKEIL